MLCDQISMIWHSTYLQNISHLVFFFYSGGRLMACPKKQFSFFLHGLSLLIFFSTPSAEKGKSIALPWSFHNVRLWESPHVMLVKIIIFFCSSIITLKRKKQLPLLPPSPPPCVYFVFMFAHANVCLSHMCMQVWIRGLFSCVKYFADAPDKDKRMQNAKTSDCDDKSWKLLWKCRMFLSSCFYQALQRFLNKKRLSKCFYDYNDECWILCDVLLLIRFK